VDVIAQRGWWPYNADRALEAITAFQDAARRGTSAAMRRDATYGLLLSMLTMNMTNRPRQGCCHRAPLARSARRGRGQILDQRGVRAYNTGDYAARRPHSLRASGPDGNDPARIWRFCMAMPC